MEMNCPNHGVALVHREGFSQKNGKKYDFWGCTQKDNGNWCSYKANGNTSAPSVGQTGPEPHQQATVVQSSYAARLEIAKALISRGHEFSDAIRTEAEAWLAYVEERVVPFQTASAVQPQPRVELGSDEVRLEDIPF